MSSSSKIHSASRGTNAGINVRSGTTLQPDVSTTQSSNETIIDEKINSLKTQFQHIKEARTDVKNIFISIDDKVRKLKEIYAEFVEHNKTDLFVFGLDCFHFQSKMIDFEYHDMIKTFKLLNNRIYGDFFKLEKFINEYIMSSGTNDKMKELTKRSVEYPKYDYIDVYKEYNFEYTARIFNDVMAYLVALNETSKGLHYELVRYRQRSTMGLSINNFVHTYEYTIGVLREQILLYINYTTFFINLHVKYLGKFITKLKIMYAQITNEIHFEDIAYGKRNQTRKEIYNDLEKQVNNKELINEMKQMISDGDSSTSESTDEVRRTPFQSKLGQGSNDSFESSESGESSDTDMHDKSIFSISERKQLETIFTSNPEGREGGINSVALRGMTLLLGNVRQRRVSVGGGGGLPAVVPVISSGDEIAPNTAQTGVTNAEIKMEIVKPIVLDSNHDCAGDSAGTSADNNNSEIPVVSDKESTLNTDKTDKTDDIDETDDFALALKAQSELLVTQLGDIIGSQTATNDSIIPDTTV